jgi:hypothetical protein
MKFAYAAIAALAVTSTPASAQARFQTGAFAWTPTLTVRDAGTDTNVFDEPVNPKADTVATFAPQIAGKYDNGTWSLELNGGVDFVYFRRYADERSFNRRATGRFDLALSRVHPFAGAGYLNTRERQNAEIDLRARRSERDFLFGTRIETFSRTSFEVFARRADLTFEQGEVFRGEDLAQRLNRESTSAGGRALVQLTPLTTFVVESDLVRDRFVYRPTQDTDNTRVSVGFEFDPDAVIRGRARLGYRDMRPLGGEALGYEGLTASVDLSYVLLARTRFDARINRDATYSFEEQPYYVWTAYGGEVLHNVAGPLDLIGRYTRETLDYPGIPERNVAAHLDYVRRYGGGIAVRVATRLTISLNYEYAERDSGESPELSFNRRRVFTTVVYGF